MISKLRDKIDVRGTFKMLKLSTLEVATVKFIVNINIFTSAAKISFQLHILVEKPKQSENRNIELLT